ncbi:hypothetical protein [Alteromonas sp. BMJM2]|uniref:hypothetical protein n=1 Tax=Alteromonas sp. BMJM2 TaxID=2954241 RepID=UPI0022B428F2|nr:hypothetical protein [Alteromonas sp. BMJM2]
MKVARGGLLNAITIGVLIALMSMAYVKHMMPVLEEAETVKKEALLGNFQRIVMQARAQWIRTKNSSVFIYETQVDPSGTLSQNKRAGTSVAMNTKGWPVGSAKGSSNPCDYLLSLAGDEVGSKMHSKTRKQNSFLLCEYFIDEQPWFTYSAENGAMRNHYSY